MATKEVVIYQASRHCLKKRLILFGNILLLFVLFGFIFTFGPLLKAEINYQLKTKTKPRYHQKLFGDLLQIPLTPSVIESPDPYFSIAIPKIEAKAKILANIDAGNKKEYTAALKKGVAHAKGTVFPGMKGTIYLFAHSTDAPWNIVHYNAVFFLLDKLEKNDQVVIFFQGKKFNYWVEGKKIISLTDIEHFNQKDEEILALQTCYPPGTTKNALVVLAKRNNNL